MTKGIILRIFMSLIILAILCLYPALIAIAEDCQECDQKGTPTSAGNSKYSDGWPCKCINAKPIITASSETIVKGGSITLQVKSGGLACPLYTWSTTSKGYTLNKTKTNNDEIVTLSCTTGTCGTNYDVYATIRVTDNCGEWKDIVIRNTSGTWVHVAACDATFGSAINCQVCTSTQTSGKVRYTIVSLENAGHSDCPVLPYTIPTCTSGGFTFPSYVATAGSECSVACDNGCNNTPSECVRLRGYLRYKWSCP
jgi:hypothetical protein